MHNNEILEVDPNDAPEGFIAKLDIDGDSCEGCYFIECSGVYCGTCTGYSRKDNQFVIFIKKQETKATMSYPCGSLGEEIE